MNNFFLLLSLTILSVPFAFGQSPFERQLGCEGEINPFINIIQTVHQHSCVYERYKESEYCNCLKNSEGFLQVLNADVSTEAYKEAALKLYKDRLLGLYSQMNYGASFQENTFKMRHEDDLQNGCSPDSIAKNFEKSIKSENSDGSELKDAVVLKNGKNLANCSEGAECEDLYKEINNQFENYKKSPSYAKMLVQREKVRQASSQMCSSDDLFEFTKEQVGKLEEIKTFYKKYPKLATDPLYLTSINDIINNKKFCKSDFQKNVYDDIIYEYSQKAKFGDNQNRSLMSSSGLEVLNDLKKNDERITKKLEKNFETSSLPQACIQYDHFKILNSTPGPKLIEAWSGQDVDTIAASLDPLSLIKNKNISESLHFIKNNPTLAKLITNSEMRKKLASSLKNLATSSVKKDHPGRVEDYIKFMQRDVSPLVKENHISDQHQCVLLAKNFAAVFSTNSLPELDFMGNSKDPSDVANDLLACKVKDNNSIPDHKIDDVLAANQLYRIFDEETSPENFGPENDKDYLEFLDLNCAGFAELTQQAVKDCKGREKCISNLSKTSNRRREKLQEKFFEKRPDLLALNKVIKSNTKALNMKTVGEVTNEKKQDEKVREYYEKVIAPKTKSSIYSSYNPSTSQDGLIGTQKIMERAQAEFNASPSVESNVSGPVQTTKMNTADRLPVATQNVNAQNSIPQTKASVNPGQLIPPFLSNKVSNIANTNISSAGRVEKKLPPIDDVDDVEKIIENLEDYSVKDQTAILKKSKEILDLQNQKDQEIIALQKQLDEELEKESHLPVSEGGRAPASTNFNITPHTLGGTQSHGGIPALSGVGQGGAVGKISASSMNKSATSYEKALNQIHENTNVNGSENILVDKNSVFEFNGPISKNELNGQVMVGVSLTPDSDLFAEISVANKGNERGEALKAYLADKLKLISSDQIISIKCQNTAKLKCGVNDELLLHISKDGKNNLIIRSIANDTKVARASIKDLNNTIDLETKIKQ